MRLNTRVTERDGMILSWYTSDGMTDGSFLQRKKNGTGGTGVSYNNIRDYVRERIKTIILLIFNSRARTNGLYCILRRIWKNILSCVLHFFLLIIIRKSYIFLYFYNNV